MGRRRTLLAAAVLLLGLAAPAAAEPVRVRAAAHDTFGRIVFNWDAPVGFATDGQGTRLTVRFDRPIEADYLGVVRTLSTYLRAAEPGADGASVVLTLRQPFTARAFDLGSAVVVDLLRNGDEAAAAPSPSSAPSSAPAPAAAPSTGPVGVRSGEHERFTRLVFDWPRRVDYRVDRDGDTVAVTFDDPAPLSLAALSGETLDQVAGVAARPSAGGSGVTLNLRPGRGLRHFRSETKVVVDVLSPGTPETVQPGPDGPLGPVNDLAAAPPAPEPAPEPAPTPAPQAAPEAAPEAAPRPETLARAEPAPEPASEPAPEAAPEAAPEPAPEAAPAPEPMAAAPEQAAEPAPAPEPMAAAPEQAAEPAPAPEPMAAAPESSPAPESVPAPEPLEPATAEPMVEAPAPASPGAPRSLIPGGPRPAASASGSMAAPEPAPQAAPSGAMPEAQPTDGPMTAVAPQEPPPPVSVPLRFAWNQPVAAAVFRRAGGLWVVFDRPSNPNLEALRQAGGRAFRDVRRVPTGNGTVLRFETNGELNPALLRDGLTWIVDLRPRPITAHTDIESNAQPDSPIGARIFLPIPEPGQPILVADPEAGDNLIVVPVIPLGHGVKNGYAYPQLDVLPSAQGIVLQPRVDDLRVRSLRQGVEITAGTQLQISAVSAEQAAESKLKTLHPLTRTMDLERWRGADLADVNERRQELRAAVAAARGETDIEQGRLDLARFLLANALSAEALGVLRVVGADRPEAAGEPEVRTLRAAANFLMGRYADAQADMADPVVDPFDEGRFWRAALRAAEGDKAEAAPDLKRTGAITRPYPNALKVPLGLLVAESMIEVGEVTQAAEYLAALGAADLSEDQALEHAYVTGRLQELQGDFDGAVKTWEEVIAGDHRPSRAKAAMARAELLLKQRKITRPEAIAEMEALRFAWRGDDFEFNLLRRLGTLYLAENDPRNGLRTLRQAVTHFRDHPAVDTVAQQMTDAFHDLYLEDKADVLAPVTAIALYDEFKELTPAGEQGDEMIRKLADRLVAVDLLDRAADLLDNQVKFRLKGEQKARVGARLALVRIMNRQPDLAVAALDASAPDKTGDAALPDDLKAQRRHLRARALADLAQDGQALALLNDDATTDANLLRSDILWQVQDWSNAARALRQTLRDEGIRPNQALDDRAARRVLNLGVALTLAGNERAVSRLRRDYGPAMDQTLFRDAFRLVADTPEPGPTDVRRLSELVSEAENFRGFMGAYRDRLRDGRLSAIN